MRMGKMVKIGSKLMRRIFFVISKLAGAMSNNNPFRKKGNHQVSKLTLS
jgi:hypothetical protein